MCGRESAAGGTTRYSGDLSQGDTPTPFKMVAFDTGVNITPGLPSIRTSVDHGTAFDIAWTGRADPTRHAVFAAARLAGVSEMHGDQ